MRLEPCLMKKERSGREPDWPTVWTRDISYSTHLGLGLWNVRACMNSLNARVRNGEVEQDTGTGGSWPISSDRVVWGMAAWEVYCLTGDADWLSLSCRVMGKDMHEG